MSFACGTVVLAFNNYTQAVNTLHYAYYALLFVTVLFGGVAYIALTLVYPPDHPAMVLFGTMLAAGSTASLSVIASAKSKYFYELRKARGEDVKRCQASNQLSDSDKSAEHCADQSRTNHSPKKLAGQEQL